MTGYQIPYGQGQAPAQFNSFRQIQDMFPQPQGSVYSINTPTEIGNVPIGSTGLSVAICFAEQLMYIKSFQNGNPVIMAYRVIPYSKEERVEETSNIPELTLEDRLSRLEQQLSLIINKNTEGGKFDGLL